MAKLFGFKKLIKGSSGSVIDLAENYVKSNMDEFGGISDPAVYRSAMKILKPKSYDLDVANKILQYESNARKLESSIQDAVFDKSTQEFFLNEAMLEAVAGNYENPQNMVFRIADLFNAAKDNFDTEVLPKVIKRLGAGQQIPSEVNSWRDELTEKSNMFSQLANSYRSVDEKTNLPGPANPDVFGWFIKTNPSTGRIVNIELKTVDSVDKAPTGFAKTNSRYGRLPVYLNFFPEDEDKKARLGANEFKFDSDKNILKRDKADKVPFFPDAIARAFVAFGPETFKGEKQKEEEINLQGVSFDMLDIPLDSVTKDGRGNYHYFDRNGKLWRAKDKDLLSRYLKEINRPLKGEDIDNELFLVNSDFIRSMSPVDEEERVINENFFETPVPPTSQSNIPPLGESTGLNFSQIRPTQPIAPLTEFSTKPKAVKEPTGQVGFFQKAKDILRGAFS